ncbi:hypothetical protein J437_LFUL010051 [Ladona fulva]|uniref:NHR domain-containing protein n=1 Tax=Ladona fulva TaxID=123851 RepID=A0A8K0NTX7_LADFU|nr:hypothetical protein J437_LFUL018614 [Ladona fulva]KAG8229297.1 hypothetical protein J437_LFUL010051 [Ladona fulva]
MAFNTACIISLLILLACKGSDEAECEVNSRKDRELKMNINSARNALGDWTNTFSATKESSSITSNINLDVAFNVSECHERHKVHIRGVLAESTKANSQVPLLFHPNCGSNIAITNDGQSIVKLKDEEEMNGVTLTNRPLYDNEIFEVRLDRKISKFNKAMGIGVTTQNPKTLKIPRHMNDVKDGTWMIYLSTVYINGTRVKENYIEDLQNQKVTV